MQEIAHEVNFDGIVGPTHNYSGLAFGNIASEENKKATSNPKEAALQGLAKMKTLSDLDIKQAVLPPHERPNIPALKRLGYDGSDAEILEKAYKDSPETFSKVCSASSMWTANAATISPSADTADNKVHITVANLSANFHRSIEHKTSSRILGKIFNDPEKFTHHKALVPAKDYCDEGAANHSRICQSYGSRGIEIFVFGRYVFESSIPRALKGTVLSPEAFPARQSFEASQAVARLHNLSPKDVIFVQQNPNVIDKGVFHNDVISVGNRNVFLYHEFAFVNTKNVVSTLEERYNQIYHVSSKDSSIYKKMNFIEVHNDQVSVEEAVKSYLFNSQIVDLGKNGDMAIIAPSESEENENVKAFLDGVVEANNPIKEVRYMNLRQSMRNGGGPACLRLRAALTTEEIRFSHDGVYLDDALHKSLHDWINKHYRDELCLDDMSDPKFLDETRRALDELTQILKLGSVYEFQN